MDHEEILKGIQLSENFTAYEFCNSLDAYAIKLPDIELVEKLQMLRNIVGEITVTSGYRTIEFNKSCGGSPNSHHLRGLAADIKFDFTHWNKSSLSMVLKAIGFTNVNFYWNFTWQLQRLHVDIGETWNGEEFNYRDLKA